MPASLKLAWGSGQLAPYSIFAIVSAQLLVYLTDQVGIAPVTAGLILFSAKAYDIFSDVAVGVCSDRFDTRWGRRRPWIAAGSITLAASLLAMFHVDGAAPGFQMLAATASVFLFYTGVSLFTIPHMAMAAEMSNDYHERTSIQAYGSTFSVIANLIGTSVAPLLIVGAGVGAAGHHRMALVLAPLPLIAGALCVIGTARAPRAARTRVVIPSLRLWLASFVGNRPLVALLASRASYLVGAAAASNSILYYSIHVVGLGQRGMVAYGVSSTIGAVAGLIITVRFLTRRWAKHKLCAAMLIGMAFSMLSFLLVPRGNVWLFVTPAFFAAIFSTPGLMLAGSMVADVVEHDHLTAGVHRAGAITAIVSTVNKGAPAVSALIVGAILSIGGYQAASATQSPDAIRAIQVCVVVMPALLILISAIPMLFLYDLDEDALKRQRRSVADSQAVIGD